MQLIQARLHGSPRTVETKYGSKVVADAIDGQGTKHTIWRNPGELKHLTNGSVVSLTVDSRGKVSLVDVETTVKQQVGFAALSKTATTDSQPSRSIEITDYIERLGKLYSHCLTTAMNMPTSIELESTAVKDVATTMFIQTVRHFDL